jgi:hypothetical protein
MRDRDFITRNRDLLCEIATCNARSRLITRGRHLLCEIETYNARSRLITRDRDLLRMIYGRLYIASCNMHVHVIMYSP